MIMLFIVLNTMATITQVKVMKALDRCMDRSPTQRRKSVEPAPFDQRERHRREKADKEKVYKSMLQRADLDPSIELLERDDSFTVALQDDVLFETGLNQISPRMFSSSTQWLRSSKR